MSRPTQVSNEAFVREWQTATCFGDVEKALGVMGLKTSAVRARANHLRRRGVPLQKFKRTGQDYEALADLANRIGDGQQIAARKG